MKRTVEFYVQEDGTCPAQVFLDSLTDQEAKKVAWVIKLIEDLDMVPKQYFKKLVDTEDIWECRVPVGGNAYRLFSFFFKGNTVIITHGYGKKSQKTDAREIKRAEAYRRDFLKLHGGD